MGEALEEPSGTVKVLNSGLGPFKDQSAEMVLFLYFITLKSFFPYYDYNVENKQISW